MRNKITILLLVFFLAAAAGVLSAKIKTKAFNLKTDKIEDLDSMAVEQLAVKVLPVKGHAVYISLPDGGNILVDTGRKSDARKLMGILKSEITEGEKKFGVMSFLGWKPRLDWIILTGSSPDRIGGLEKLLTRFNVRKVISYAGMDPRNMVNDNSIESRLRRLADVILTLNVDHITLAADEELDLEQVVSPVKMVALNSKDNLSLQLTYSDFNFIILSETDGEIQERIAGKYGNAEEGTVLYAYGSVSDVLKNAVKPRFRVKVADDVTFITDGRYLSTIPYDYLVK